MIRILSTILLILAVGSAIGAIFSISVGIISAVIVLIGIIFAIIDRRDGLWKRSLGAICFGILGIIFAVAGAVGMMGLVNDNCGSLDPRSDEGITCFNQNYNRNWGIFHVLEEK